MLYLVGLNQDTNETTGNFFFLISFQLVAHLHSLDAAQPADPV